MRFPVHKHFPLDVLNGLIIIIIGAARQPSDDLGIQGRRVAPAGCSEQAVSLAREEEAEDVVNILGEVLPLLDVAAHIGEDPVDALDDLRQLVLPVKATIFAGLDGLNHPAPLCRMDDRPTSPTVEAERYGRKDPGDGGGAGSSLAKG